MEDGDIKVTVETPSRLHFGIIDLRGSIGRIHGSAGVAIDRPNIVLTAERGETIKATGVRAERIVSNAAEILKHVGVSKGASFTTLSDIPEHYGFGSGTQLALAVGLSLTKLYDLELDLLSIAQLLGRSNRSGVGTHAFIHGGFILDGGRKKDNNNVIPPLLFRSDIPEEWRFVVGVPKIDLFVAGGREDKAFRTLEPPSEELVWQISHVVLLGMLPGILEKDIEAFGSAMTKMDSIFGDYWVKVQGGRYGHPVLERGIRSLLDAGAYGAGQSSWGPAFYGLAKDQAHAERLSKELEVFFRGNEIIGHSIISRPRNSGARITFEED